MKRHWIALSMLALTGAALGQTVDRQASQEQAYITYFRCINVYASRYFKSEALVADVGDAAMSACQDRYQDLLNATTVLVGSQETAQGTLKDVRENARNFAVRLVLEARFPSR